MRILVTGHRGYIGSLTTASLTAAGHEVIGLDTGFFEVCADASERPIDARDVRDVRAAELAGLDAVVHLAALSNDPLGALDPSLTLRINRDATVTLAVAAKAAGVGRFVFASSCSMYGAAGSGKPVDEESPLRPLTTYAESKVRSEEALFALADASFSPICMRNATAYGVSPRLRVDLVLNNLVGWALTTNTVRVLSDGSPWRPLVHVQDIARATLALLEAPRELVHAEAVNVGADSENYRVRDLAEIVAETVPGSSIEYAGSVDPDPRSYRVSFGKLRRMLPDLELTWDARAGARELLAEYRRVGLSSAGFGGERYNRVACLRGSLASGALDEDLRWIEGSGAAAGRASAAAPA